MSNWFFDIHNDTSLEQGDIIENCRIICPGETEYHALLQENPTHVDMNYIECDCIIMSQSCDLENNKIKYVILCPIATLQNAMKSFELLKSKRPINNHTPMGSIYFYIMCVKLLVRKKYEFLNYFMWYNNIVLKGGTLEYHISTKKKFLKKLKKRY